MAGELTATNDRLSRQSAELAELNAGLDRTVAERTAELERSRGEALRNLAAAQAADRAKSAFLATMSHEDGLEATRRIWERWAGPRRPAPASSP